MDSETRERMMECRLLQLGLQDMLDLMSDTIAPVTVALGPVFTTNGLDIYMDKNFDEYFERFLRYIVLSHGCFTGKPEKLTKIFEVALQSAIKKTESDFINRPYDEMVGMGDRLHLRRCLELSLLYVENNREQIGSALNDFSAKIKEQVHPCVREGFFVNAVEVDYYYKRLDITFGDRVGILGIQTLTVMPEHLA